MNNVLKVKSYKYLFLKGRSMQRPYLVPTPAPERDTGNSLLMGIVLWKK